MVSIQEIAVFTSSNTSVRSGGLFMHTSLKIFVIVVIFTEYGLRIAFIPVTLLMSQETESVFNHKRASFFSPFFFIYFVFQTDSFKIFKQEAMHETTFDQLGIAKFCPKQEIIDVITNSKEEVCIHTQIAKFMGPTRGPFGSCRPQMGPMLAPWIMLAP